MIPRGSTEQGSGLCTTPYSIHIFKSIPQQDVLSCTKNHLETKTGKLKGQNVIM